MRHISTPGDSAWSREDLHEQLKAELARWKDRAITLSHNIEMACDALRKGEEVTLTDNRGPVVVVKSTIRERVEKSMNGA